MPVRGLEGLYTGEQKIPPCFDAPLDRLEPLPLRARRRYAFRATLPVLMISPLCAVFFFPWGLVALLITLPAVLYGVLCFRAAGHGMVGDKLVLRFRRLARATVIAPGGRLQSRGYSVSPLQRRKGLATFEIEVGSGGTAFRLADVEAEVTGRLMEALSNPAARSER